MSGRHVTAVPLRVPRLTRNEAEARTLLAQNVQALGVMLGEQRWQLTIEPLAHDASIGFAAGDWVIHAEWSGARFELRLPASAADMWVRGHFPGEEWPALPPPIRAAAFESALSDTLRALGGAERGDVRVDGIDHTAAAPFSRNVGQHFGLSLAREGATLLATLSTDSFGLMLLAGLAASEPAAPGPLPRDGVPILLRAEIGAATLTKSQLRSLATGDAVLVEHYRVDAESHLWLRHAGWGMKVRAGGTQLEVVEPFGSMEGMMEDDDFDEDFDDNEDFTDEEPAELDALPVRLLFDIGQRTIALGELCQLQVGQVLELTRPLSHAVNIRANGALVGTGELMEIGGRIAVGITSLGRARGEPQ